MKKEKVILALVSMSLVLSMLIGQVAAVPYGTMINAGFIPGAPDIWTLTSSPDRRIWGGTSGGWAGSQLFYYLPQVCNSTAKMVVVGNPLLEVYALTTSVCGNSTSINYTATTNFPYFIYGGSYMANPAWYLGQGAQLFKYVPDVAWIPGITWGSNPYDFGPWHRISGGPGPAFDSVLPTDTLIYKLSAGPCGKIYGGSGWDGPNHVGSNYGDYAYFFVFDPVTENIIFDKWYQNATEVNEVLAGRDGNVYFLTQYDLPGSSYTVLSRYNPVLHTVTQILDSSTILPTGSWTFTCMTWSVDHNGNPRIYIGATETIGTVGLAWLIQLDPTAPYHYDISPTALKDPINKVQIGTIRDLTTGIFSEEVYGVGTGQDSASVAHGYFFMYCQCKVNASVSSAWSYWNPSVSPLQGDPWIAGAPWPGMGPVNRLRTIVTGQEAQNGYCVSNQDPHVYMGEGFSAGGATLFSYLPLTADVNLDQKVDMKDIGFVARQFGIDPPEEGASAQLATVLRAPLNLLTLAVVLSAAIALPATVFKLKRKKISEHRL